MTYTPSSDFFDRSNRQAKERITAHQCEFTYPDARRCRQWIDTRYMYCYGHNEQIKRMKGGE